MSHRKTFARRRSSTSSANPIVSYEVHVSFDDGEPQTLPYDKKSEAVDAARMAAGGGASFVEVCRTTVVDTGTINWRA